MKFTATTKHADAPNEVGDDAFRQAFDKLLATAKNDLAKIDVRRDLNSPKDRLAGRQAEDDRSVSPCSWRLAMRSRSPLSMV